MALPAAEVMAVQMLLGEAAKKLAAIAGGD